MKLKSKKSARGPGRLQKKSPAHKNEFPAEKELHKQGVLLRGEAAKRGKDGKLPPGATHEIVGNDIVRVRYSMV